MAIAKRHPLGPATPRPCSPSRRRSWKPSARWRPSTRLAIPPYYFSLIDPDDPNDPIRLQSVPSPLEQRNPSGYELEDPLEEDKDSPVPGLTHRYPDRALLVTTHVCTMYCRFCTRKRATMVRGGWDAISRNDERHDRVRPRPPRDPRRDRLGRRPADAAGQPSCASSWTTWRPSRTSMSSASARACR